MSLDKAIKSGKEWRKPYRTACQRHGCCSACQEGRQYANRKRIEAAKEREEELMKLESEPRPKELRDAYNRSLRLIGIDIDLY